MRVIEVLDGVGIGDRGGRETLARREAREDVDIGEKRDKMHD